MPDGSIWEPEIDGGLDKLLDGIAANSETMAVFLEKLAHIRDPDKTFLLSDLEKEYGIPTDPLLTEEERRTRLKPRVYPGDKTGTADDLQEALDLAGYGAGGYGLQVHINDPPVDPGLFGLSTLTFYQVIAGGDGAYAGFIPSGGSVITSVAGTGLTLPLYEWVVNGELLKDAEFVYVMQTGGDNSFLGNQYSILGVFTGLAQELMIYVTPTDPVDWPFCFFVGGAATRDGSGALTAITPVNFPSAKKADLKNIILRIKPMHSWCGLIVNYT